MPTIKEKIALVQSYIKHRKDVEVDINLEQFDYDVFSVFKLNQAYDTAYKWFMDNNGRVEVLK
jgi:hypothetical protein